MKNELAAKIIIGTMRESLDKAIALYVEANAQHFANMAVQNALDNLDHGAEPVDCEARAVKLEHLRVNFCMVQNACNYAIDTFLEDADG